MPRLTPTHCCRARRISAARVGAAVARQSVSAEVTHRLCRFLVEMGGVAPACSGAAGRKTADLHDRGFDRDRDGRRDGRRGGRGGARDGPRAARGCSWAAPVHRGRHRSAASFAAGWTVVLGPVPPVGAENRTARACGTGSPAMVVLVRPRLPPPADLLCHHTSRGCRRRKRRLGHCNPPRRRYRWRVHGRGRYPEARTRPAYRATRAAALARPPRPGRGSPGVGGCAGAHGGGGPTSRARHAVGAR